ncbi:MAG: hypothetical protein HN909_05670 [Phycisphaerales bacterium]|jgi:hypothetical protein|nr:hypothetical protein [Phycisphaerales bacterium]MBT7171242.1 hypothetical protein [Phycisphaerales bacterium]
MTKSEYEHLRKALREQYKKNNVSPKAARAALYRAGIVTEKGNLRKVYGG